MHFELGFVHAALFCTMVRFAGHNGCFFCLKEVQARKPECPLCRAAFPLDYPLRYVLALIFLLLAFVGSCHRLCSIFHKMRMFAWWSGSELSSYLLGMPLQKALWYDTSQSSGCTSCVAFINMYLTLLHNNIIVLSRSYQAPCWSSQSKNAGPIPC
jgi:hypothetical protein